MAIKRDPISEILEEARQEAEHLTRYRSSDGSRIKLQLVCALLGEIQITVERKAEVMETIGEIKIATSGIISRKFFELVIGKIKS